MDWAFLVLVLAFAVRGWIRGCFSQLFAFAGLLAGLWVAAWVSQWVGLEWQHARPAAVFWVLRALTVLLAGLATAAVLASIGERAREAAEGGLLGFLDRGAGLLLGVAFGASGVALMLLAALLLPVPRALKSGAVHARTAPPIVRRAVQVCSWGRRIVPGSGWLETQFLAAERRLEVVQRPT